MKARGEFREEPSRVGDAHDARGDLRKRNAFLNDDDGSALCDGLADVSRAVVMRSGNGDEDAPGMTLRESKTMAAAPFAMSAFMRAPPPRR